MKNVKQIALLLLALLLIVSATACGGEEQPAGTAPEVGGTQAPVTEGPKYDSAGYLMDRLPELDFGDETVDVLYWADCKFPIVSEEESKRVIDQETYKKNSATEERLAVHLNFIPTLGAYANRTAYLAHLENTYDSGMSYDIVCGQCRVYNAATCRGYMTNLLDIKDSYLDYEMPWWPKKLTETMTVGNSLYSLAGDISVDYLGSIYGIFYNVDMLNDLGLEDPVTYVEDGSWTIEKLMEMTEGVYNDADYSSGKTSGDFYGLVIRYFGWNTFYIGSEMTILDRDEENYLVLSEDYTAASHKLTDLQDRLRAYNLSEACYSTGIDSGGIEPEMFRNKQALFAQIQLQLAYFKVGGQTDFKYGVLPNPKYDTEQKEYITWCGYDATCWGIMKGNEESKMQICTAVLEALASKGYRTTTVFFYENTMQVKFSENQTVSDMFEMLRSNVLYDMGYAFDTSTWNGLNMGDLQMETIYFDKGWASEWASIQEGIYQCIENINRAYGKPE